MYDQVVREQLRGLVQQAIAMTDERMGRAAPAGGDPVLVTIREQLGAVASDIATDAGPSASLQDRITFGFLASRQYEDSDPAYRDLLVTIVYLYRQKLAPAGQRR